MRKYVYSLFAIIVIAIGTISLLRNVGSKGESNATPRNVDSSQNAPDDPGTKQLVNLALEHHGELKPQTIGHLKGKPVLITYNDNLYSDTLSKESGNMHGYSQEQVGDVFRESFGSSPDDDPSKAAGYLYYFVYCYSPREVDRSNVLLTDNNSSFSDHPEKELFICRGRSDGLNEYLIGFKVPYSVSDEKINLTFKIKVNKKTFEKELQYD